MVPQRIQRKRTKGWRMPAGAVYVGRPSRWGNPFHVGFPFSLDDTVRLFRDLVVNREARYLVGSDEFVHRAERSQLRKVGKQLVQITTPTVEEIRAELAGSDLACWCPLEDANGSRVPCHADVLLELANSEVSG